MAEFPALQLWTDAYLGDTNHLTAIEHGAYLLLLIAAWRTRGVCLPDDDKILAKYARCSAGQWKRIRPVLARFYEIENGTWHQGRLADEAKAVRQKRESAAANGRLSALKRYDRHASNLEIGSNELSTTTATATAITPLGKEPNGHDEDFVDPVKVLFDAGIKLLGRSGIADGKARTLIGKWRSEYDTEAVIAALGVCQREGAVDPVAFIAGVLRNRQRFEEYDDPDASLPC